MIAMDHMKVCTSTEFVSLLASDFHYHYQRNTQYLNWQHIAVAHCDVLMVFCCEVYTSPMVL